jgi:transposase
LLWPPQIRPAATSHRNIFPGTRPDRTYCSYRIATAAGSSASTQDLIPIARERPAAVEKRFEQIKTVHEIARVSLKNTTRIKAFFTLCFLALLVQVLSNGNCASA